MPLEVYIYSLFILSIVSFSNCDLLLHLTFDGDCTDQSAYKRNTTAVGNAVLTSDRFNNPNSAIQFIQSGHIKIDDSDGLAIGKGEYTISAWVKFDKLSQMRIYSFGSEYCSSITESHVPGYQFGTSYNGKRFHQEFTCADDDKPCGLNQDGIQELSTGNWYFVANTVFPGRSATIYVNSEYDVHTNLVFTCDKGTYSNNTALIGSRESNELDQFYGSIDDLRVYGRALSQNEIKLLYNENSTTVTIVPDINIIYDFSPKLLIKGSGFDTDEHNIILDLQVCNDSSLKLDLNYVLSKVENGIVLKLLANNKWAYDYRCALPTIMILKSVKFLINPEKNLLKEPVVIAKILPTPIIIPNTDDISATLTQLRILGSGFIGADSITFIFNPQLYLGIHYQIISSFPLTNDFVDLRLNPGKKWRDQSGYLKVLGVNTGAGPIKVNGDDGCVVAIVRSDVDIPREFEIEDTSNSQWIYNDYSYVTIKGDGLYSTHTSVRFSNGLLDHVNYTSVISSKTEITLRLVPGSYWRMISSSLPAPLTVEAINLGRGFIAVQPYGGGVNIATIVEKPSISSQIYYKIYQTLTKQLHIFGSGFLSSKTPKLSFDPPLKQDFDYSIGYVSSNEMILNLFSSWRLSPGYLAIKAINTLGGSDIGWVYFSVPIKVAEVLKDINGTIVSIDTISTRIHNLYQSSKNRTVTLYGKGFYENMAILFNPKLTEGLNYTIISLYDNIFTIYLNNSDNSKLIPGIIKIISIDRNTFNVAIAKIFEDPVIEASRSRYRSSQTKIVTVKGHGFTSTSLMSITLSPTDKNAYEILSVQVNSILLKLKPDSVWYDPLETDDYYASEIDLYVTSINTGAGEYKFNPPIAIGVLDPDGIEDNIDGCSNTCAYSYDGVCDDPRGANYCRIGTDCADCGPYGFIPSHQPSTFIPNLISIYPSLTSPSRIIPSNPPYNIRIIPTSLPYLPYRPTPVPYTMTSKPSSQYVIIDPSDKSSQCTQEVLSTCSLDDESYPTFDETIICMMKHYNSLGKQCNNILNFVLVYLNNGCNKDITKLCYNDILSPIRTLGCLYKYKSFSKLSFQCRMKLYDLDSGKAIPCGAEAGYYCSEEEHAEDIPLCLSLIDYSSLSNNCLNTLSNYQSCLIMDQNEDYYSSNDPIPCWEFNSQDDQIDQTVQDNNNNNSNNSIISTLIILIIVLLALIIILIFIIFLRPKNSNVPNRSLYVRAATNEGSDDITGDGIQINAKQRKKSFQMINLNLNKNKVESMNDIEETVHPENITE